MTDANQILTERLVDAREAAYCLKVPIYLLTHPKERQRLSLPHYRVGKMVRFKVSELMAWMQAKAEAEAKGESSDA
jgi:predicted Zn-dependent protease